MRENNNNNRKFSKRKQSDFYQYLVKNEGESIR